MDNTRSRLNQLISHLRLSKNEFAREIGLSSAMVSKITTKDINFGIDVFKKIISRYTNLNQQWLLTGTGEMWLKPSALPKQDIPTSDANDAASMADVVSLGVKLSEEISKRPVLYDGYFEENKLAFYLKHSDKRLDGLLSVAVDELRGIYEAYRKLILFSKMMGEPDFFPEKFQNIPDFNNYKSQVIDKEFKETYAEITDKKVLKCTRLISYESDIEYYIGALTKLIEYMSRYSDLYAGYQQIKK